MNDSLLYFYCYDFGKLKIGFLDSIVFILILFKYFLYLSFYSLFFEWSSGDFDLIFEGIVKTDGG